MAGIVFEYLNVSIAYVRLRRVMNTKISGMIQALWFMTDELDLNMMGKYSYGNNWIV